MLSWKLQTYRHLTEKKKEKKTWIKKNTGVQFCNVSIWDSFLCLFLNILLQSQWTWQWKFKAIIFICGSISLFCRSIHLLTSLNVTFQIITVMQMIHKYICPQAQWLVKSTRCYNFHANFHWQHSLMDGTWQTTSQWWEDRISCNWHLAIVI